MPNFIEVLQSDHRRIEKLFARYERTRDPAIGLEVCGELELHTALEAAILYGELRQELQQGHPQVLSQELSQEMASHVIHAHSDIDELVDQLRAADDENKFRMTMVQLRQLVVRHIKEEETKIFPSVEVRLSPQRLEELGDLASLLAT